MNYVKYACLFVYQIIDIEPTNNLLFQPSWYNFFLQESEGYHSTCVVEPFVSWKLLCLDVTDSVSPFICRIWSALSHRGSLLSHTWLQAITPESNFYTKLNINFPYNQPTCCLIWMLTASCQDTWAQEKIFVLQISRSTQPDPRLNPKNWKKALQKSEITIVGTWYNKCLRSCSQYDI